MTPRLTAVDTLVDTHAHLDASGGIPSLATPAAKATAVTVIAVTNLPRHYAKLRTIRHERVQWALGLHPGQPHPPETIDEFLALLPGCEAIGEVGLDGTPPTGPHAVPMKRQRAELEQILNHPAAANRLATIHSRRAVPAVIEHLKAASIPGAVLHWFNGTPAQATRAADAGAYFSINHRMTGKRDLLQAIPRDRVLLETDAPHTGKSISPGNIWPALTALATLWGTTPAATEDQVLANQRALQRAVTQQEGRS